MSLSLDITMRAGSLTIEAKADLHGPATAFTGPSGAGKTSLLHVIAGLRRPERGTIAFNGETWCNSTSGLFVPAHKRRIGYVFQEGRLFPHFSVRRNLRYARWFRRKQDDIRFHDVVELLGIDHLLSRRTYNLSGGEQQRVAIGRALLASPQLLLMDEPLAALDAERRAEILPYIQRLRDHFALPMIYVSHSMEEVAQIANEVYRINNERLEKV